MTGTVLTVAGCKGGVGKTTTSINLGTAAVTAGRNALLVEADLAMANVCDFLHLDVDPEVDPTIHDVLGGNTPIEDSIYESPAGLHVLPSGSSLEGYANTDLDQFPHVVRTLREHYQFVLLDTPAGVSRETLVPMGVADGVAIVSTPRVSAVRDAKKTIQLVERVGSVPLGVVLSRTGSGTAPPSKRIADFLGMPLLGDIPTDESIAKAQDEGRAIVSYSSDAPSAKAYRRAYDRLRERLEVGDSESKKVSLE